MRMPIFALLAIPLFTYGQEKAEPSLKGTWEGAGSRVVTTPSIDRYETLFNSRMIIDTVKNDHIAGRFVIVLQEDNYESESFHFRATRRGNSYSSTQKELTRTRNLVVVNPEETGFSLMECFSNMTLSFVNGGLKMQFTCEKPVNCNSSVFFFKTSDNNALAVQQDKLINDKYEEWKKLKSGESEKARDERVEKWYNQKDFYSLTLRTPMFDKAGFSYKYIASDSLLLLKMDNAVPVPFKISPADFQSIDRGSIKSLKITDALFESLDEDYGLNGLWTVSASFDNLLPGKKIYYPNRELFDKNKATSQAKFSEKISTTTISLPKVEDEKIFASFSAPAEARSFVPPLPGDNSWAASLPPCPCTYEEAQYKIKNDTKNGKWIEYDLINAALDNFNKYHYGAKYEVRWTSKTSGQAGQQCTYDVNKKLINSGFAAGTPDLQPPGVNLGNALGQGEVLSFSSHEQYDIQPWRELSCDDYLKRWPPSLGETYCRTTINEVNSYKHLRDFTGDLPCLTIITAFKTYRDAANTNATVKKFMNNGKVSDKNEATFLLQYFRSAAKNPEAVADKYLKNFCDRVVDYLEKYLADKPENTGFTINPKDVTLPKDKEFKWYEWGKAPKDFVAATKYIKVGKETLFDDINHNIEMKCSVNIAAVDLNEDGVCGFIIEELGTYCCGTLGCTYEIYENGGIYEARDNTHSIHPTANGATLDNSTLLLRPSRNTGLNIQQLNTLFKYDKTKDTKSPVNTTISIPANLKGGSTPEELGKLMLKALQTNNKSLWASCVHPTYNLDQAPKQRQVVIDEFDEIREDFAAKGISDWTKVSFSRVAFDPCNSCAPPGEKWLSELLVEFWYKGKEFLAVVSFTPVTTYKGKYFVGKNYYHEVTRNSNK